MIYNKLASFLVFFMVQNVMAGKGYLECVGGTCSLKYSHFYDRVVELPEGVSKLKIRYSGSGDLEVRGRCDDLVIHHSGSGGLMLADLLADEVDVSYSGSGSLHVFADYEIDVDSSGSGKIFIYGQAKVEVENEGSGKIIRKK